MSRVSASSIEASLLFDKFKYLPRDSRLSITYFECIKPEILLKSPILLAWLGTAKSELSNYIYELWSPFW